MWDNSVFDAAFDAAGMRERVVPRSGGRPFMARFDRPQQIVTADGVHDTEYSIEYAHQDSPGLAAGATLTIGGADYRVTQPPTRQGDGYYAIALLEPA